MQKGILAVGLTMALSGCITSTTETGERDVIAAKSENLYAFQERKSENDATIVVTRDSGALGTGTAFGFYIDGKLAGKFYRQERAEFHVASGRYILGYGIESGLLKKGPRKEIETILSPGEKKYFRLSMDQDSNMNISPVSAK